MYGEVRSLGFMKNILLFIARMLLYVGGNLMTMVYGWEYIRLISFLLISYWQRRDAIRASAAAIMYNRFGDFGILLVCYAMES